MLNAEIMARYALAKDWRSAGFHETENHRQIGRAVRAGLGSGRLIAITGPIGVGKTVTTVPTLIAALFYDLSPEKDLKIPTQGEKRERELRKLVLRGGKPVALFIDEAHDLHSRTLNGLKRLMEVIARGGGSLSVVCSSAIRSCATTCAVRPWKRSATAPTSCPSRASERTPAPTWTGCSASAPRRIPTLMP